jgi:hypothetical protein
MASETIHEDTKFGPSLPFSGLDELKLVISGPRMSLSTYKPRGYYGRITIRMFFLLIFKSV